MKRGLTATSPNRPCVTDITEHPTPWIPWLREYFYCFSLRDRFDPFTSNSLRRPWTIKAWKSAEKSRKFALDTCCAKFLKDSNVNHGENEIGTEQEIDSNRERFLFNPLVEKWQTHISRRKGEFEPYRLVISCKTSANGLFNKKKGEPQWFYSHKS
jgi:hypothetical protein